MAFGSQFAGHCPVGTRSAARARRSLLFLCRFHSATSTFVEAAKVLPSFRYISFPLLINHDPVAKAGETPSCTISNALRELDVESNTNLVRLRFERGKTPIEDISKEFNRIRCEHCHVHSEIQLIYDYESRGTTKANAGRVGKVHPYIGSSKLCCYLCSSFIQRHSYFSFRGCHWKIYHRWSISNAFGAEETTRIFEDKIHSVFKIMKKRLKSLMIGEERPSQEPLMAETTLDLSTTATISSREVSEMTLKSPWSKWTGKG